MSENLLQDSLCEPQKSKRMMWLWLLPLLLIVGYLVYWAVMRWRKPSAEAASACSKTYEPQYKNAYKPVEPVRVEVARPQESPEESEFNFSSA